MVKTLKNRYADPGMHERFVVGVDRSKMKLYDVDPEDQTLMNDGAGKAAEDSGPIFDLTTAGKKIASEGFKM